MAGGVGSRFWPRSREKSPKQLLQIFGNRTMLQTTIDRIKPVIGCENIFIVTNRKQVDLVAEQMLEVPRENILIEPVGRSTAPCIGLAALWIQQRDPAASMIVLPADHLIANVTEFHRTIAISFEYAEQHDALGTFGITPTYPETGFGYIQVHDREVPAGKTDYREVYRVKAFAEKPNYETAQQFVASGEFYWNSGIFVWKVSAILKELETHLPEMWKQLHTISSTIGKPYYEQTLENAFSKIKSISIDYGVMEKAENVFMVNGDFGWSDVGSWDEVTRLSEVTENEDRNCLRGATFTKDSSRNYVEAGDKFVALVGVEDLIVILEKDSVLICKKGNSQDVKEVVDYLRRKQMNEYL
jgi:mannose-1-phosphate guanylyltransferase